MSTDSPSLLQHDMAVILQLACDADEADPRELLHEIAMIASKHPWPQYDQSETGATAAQVVQMPSGPVEVRYVETAPTRSGREPAQSGHDDKRNELLQELRRVENAIWQATGSSLLAGEPCPADDRRKIYERLCAAGNSLSYVIDEFAAPSATGATVEHLQRQIGYIATELMVSGDKRTLPEIVETAARATADSGSDK